MITAPEMLEERVMSGDQLALARLITLIENNDPLGLDTLSSLFPNTGNAHLIGITGPPGTGKSTIVNRLVSHLREAVGENGDQALQKIAIVAVDPSSPFTGGAILGDRIRMRDLSGDPGTFIRSMASRGALGGVATATAGVVQALDAAGFGMILIETVGAGQAEVEIARTAHTTVVIDAPGLGDDVQAIKAGILEIADILVVNKADRPGAESTMKSLRSALHFGQAASPDEADGEETTPTWIPPVLATIATEDDGIDTLATAIIQHRDHLEATGLKKHRDRDRVITQVEQMLRDELLARFKSNQSDGRYQELLNQIMERKISPRRAVRLLINGEKP
jgi:LAO/AO transport system kinase